ncbi:MAG TPA: hypothetical protein VFT49_00980 [Candidatus Saccharimonadales bacterium]|nr:hypothetical protein [Candidatus Saccharimonadales bacterium]
MEGGRFPEFNWQNESWLRKLAGSLLKLVRHQEPPEHDPLNIPDAPYDPHKPVIRVIRKEDLKDPDDWGFPE